MSFTDIYIGHTIVPDQFVIRGDCENNVSEKFRKYYSHNLNKLNVLSKSWVGFTLRLVEAAKNIFNFIVPLLEHVVASSFNNFKRRHS